MVKKLIKHELFYYLRTLIIFLPIMLLIGLSVKVLSIFESDFIGYQIAYFSSVGLLYFASIAVSLYTLVLSLVRFYKNMYSQEGYLTFSLPASTFQLVFSKLVGSVCCTLLTSIVISISWLISGFFEIEIMQELITIYDDLFSLINGVHLVLFIIELFILEIVIIVYSNILIYTCITIGQTAKKNRILLAIGAYFIYYVAIQVVVTVFMIVVAIFGLTGAFYWVGVFIENNPYTFFHMLFIGIIIIYSGLTCLGYYIIQRIINNKLNLE